MRSPSHSGSRAGRARSTAEPASSPPSSVRVHPFRFDPDHRRRRPASSAGPTRPVHARSSRRRRVPCLLVVGRTDPTAAAVGRARGLDPGAAARRRARGPGGHRRPTGRLPTAGRASTGTGGSRFRDRTVVVPDVAARRSWPVLLERPGEVVSDAEICALFGEGGASTHAEAVKTALRRIKDALAPLGLHLTRVRRGGVPARPVRRSDPGLLLGARA